MNPPANPRKGVATALIVAALVALATVVVVSVDSDEAEAAPLRRFVEADDIAETMIFLCAQQAITGQTIVVDCGRTT